MSKHTPYTLFNDVCNNKELDFDDPVVKKAWKDMNFVVMRALSNHIDCILFVDRLNNIPNITEESLYRLLIARIRKARRKWIYGKPIPDDNDLEVVCKYFDFSKEKGEEALELLSDAFVASLYDKFDTGGTGRKRVRTLKKKKK
jgi:hypothetical protein